MDRIGEIDFDRVDEVRKEVFDVLKQYELNYREAIVLAHQIHKDIDDLGIQNLENLNRKGDEE